MKTLLLFILMFITSATIVAQNPHIDSLFAELKNAKQVSKAPIYLSIARSYQKMDRLKSFDYAKLSLNAARSNNQMKQTGESLNYLGDLYWYSGDYATSSDYYFEALQIFEDTKDNQGKAICYRNIGWIYKGQKNYQLALEYFCKSLVLNKKLGKKDRILANYDDLSIAYFTKKDYPNAIQYGKKTIAYAIENNYPSGKAMKVLRLFILI